MILPDSLFSWQLSKISTTNNNMFMIWNFSRLRPKQTSFEIMNIDKQQQQQQQQHNTNFFTTTCNNNKNNNWFFYNNNTNKHLNIITELNNGKHVISREQPHDKPFRPSSKTGTLLSSVSATSAARCSALTLTSSISVSLSIVQN